MPVVLGAEMTVSEFEELKAKELKLCAYHEASHREIIELLGGAAHAEVWRNDSGDPDEKAWRGHCKIAIAPGTWRMSEAAIAVLGTDVLPQNWERFFGVAGYVGARLLAGDDEIDISNGLMGSFEMDGMSDSDLEYMGDEITYEDVRTVIALLTARWPEVKMEAEGLMDCANTALQVNR